ncbi:hypothetical protein L228DRAFT_286088 [Xylona heveae TC161]|uniref:Zn(2)-C6 fungal-type domain-containing protein n=1 Tax=Xylona heveae (strain CBS 132557 / TC161) TaxID=1328760 RepID=A0A164ZL77_XYLHT|nr:hypothetical protein L228DRAFT_286088 [Xylona heveae TC161]KZF19234.1 hypothetical protein L228DRAFT_286088 [Xylona heveae TC161]
MVGRPGRSKGCLTCRRRHLKCDETRPTCRRCEKAQINCDGYREANFIDERPRLERKAGRSNSPESLQVKPVAMSNSLLIDSQTCLTYMLLNMLKGFLNLDKTGKDKVVPWSLDSFALLRDKPLATTCLESLVIAFVGRRMGQQSMYMRGTQLYCSALAGLHKKIASPSECYSNETLLCVNMLSIFEFLNLTTRNAWLNHAIGLGRIFEQRGAAAHATPTERVIFESSRSTVILSALVTRRRTFMSRPEWKTLPWSEDPLKKDLAQHLMDVYADIPDLVVDHNEALSSSDPTDCYVRLLEIQSRTTALLQALFRWRVAWEARNPRARYEVLVDRAECPFPSIYFYEKLGLANEIGLYNAVLIMALEVAQSVDEQLSGSGSGPGGVGTGTGTGADPGAKWSPTSLDPFVNDRHRPQNSKIIASFSASASPSPHPSSSSSPSSSFPSPSPSPSSSASASATPSPSSPSNTANDTELRTLPSADLNEMATGAAIEVCRGVHYHLLDHQRSAGELFLLFPLRMAWKALGKSTTPQGRWCENMLRCMVTGEPISAPISQPSSSSHPSSHPPCSTSCSSHSPCSPSCSSNPSSTTAHADGVESAHSGSGSASTLNNPTTAKPRANNSINNAVSNTQFTRWEISREVLREFESNTAIWETD